MPEGHTTRPPAEDEGGKSIDPKTVEVAGRDFLYTCWNCGAGCYIKSRYRSFVCWNCGALCYPNN